MERYYEEEDETRSGHIVYCLVCGHPNDAYESECVNCNHHPGLTLEEQEEKEEE